MKTYAPFMALKTCGETPRKFPNQNLIRSFRSALSPHTIEEVLLLFIKQVSTYFDNPFNKSVTA